MSNESVTEDQYNATMAAAFQSQNQQVEDGQEELPITPLPDGGYEKYYNGKTGEYNWAAHAREAEYRLNQYRSPQEEQRQQTNEDNVNDAITQAQPWERAGLDGNLLAQKILESGDINESDYQALEKVGLPREFARSYIDGLLAQIDGALEEQYNYAGGEQAWDEMAEWARQNLPFEEQVRMNNLLQTDYRAGVDLLRAKRGSVARDPSFITSEAGYGNQFGYRSKNEMKADMADPRYQKDPVFRQEVARKMRSATWDMDQF